MVDQDMQPIYVKNYLDTSLITDGVLELDWIRRDSAPRMEYWDTTLNKPYTYGRGRGERTYEPNKPSPEISFVRKKLYDDYGVFYHGCFLNKYVGNKDWLGWHSDDDIGIDHSKPIAVITLGASREINWKPKSGKGYECIERQLLEDGSLFIMPAGMQDTHFHRIPKSDKPSKHRELYDKAFDMQIQVIRDLDGVVV